MLLLRIRDFFYARILTLTQIIFLCGVTIGVLDSDWILLLPSGRRHRFSTHASPTFLFGVGMREFSLDPQSVVFFFPDPHLSFAWIRSFFNNQNIYTFINTFTMCHSTRSRRRRRAATPATMLTTPTWKRRGRRRTTTPSRRMSRRRWTRTRPSSRRGPPRLQNLDASLVPWYATPFRLHIPLLLD
jgi:hypothetical protein